MEFLDHEEEWFIDDKYIYVWAPKGMDPTNAKVSFGVHLINFDDYGRKIA